MMINSNNINTANNIVDEICSDNVNVIKVKKDNGLIERKENNNKVILMEDNRQVLFG